MRPGAGEADEADLARDYGDEWVGAVRALDPFTRRVAFAAAAKHQANIAEDIATGQLVTAFTGATRGGWPHADAPNAGHQAIRTLKDAGLWPWQLVRRVLRAEGEA